MELEDIFTTTYRSDFEDAPLENDSIDIAYSVMVMEHFEAPQFFWDKVHKVLKKGGCSGD